MRRTKSKKGNIVIRCLGQIIYLHTAVNGKLRFDFHDVPNNELEEL